MRFTHVIVARSQRVFDAAIGVPVSVRERSAVSGPPANLSPIRKLFHSVPSVTFSLRLWRHRTCLPAAAALMMVCPHLAKANDPNDLLEQAFELRTVGRIAAHPASDVVALEVGGEIALVRTDTGQMLKSLSGEAPSWSPDGALLAFLRAAEGEKQIFVWSQAADEVRQLTRWEGGVSPNPFHGFLGDNSALSWSPDSRQIAFTTRVLGDYLATGARSGERVRVFRTEDAENSSLFDGVFRTDRSDVWPNAYDRRPERMRTVQREPRKGLSRLLVVDVTSKKVSQIGGLNGQYFYPAWSPNGQYVAAVWEEEGTIDYPGPARTVLAILDVAGGSERRIPGLLRRVESPRWSPSGAAILANGRNRYLGFGQVQVFQIGESKVSVMTPAPQLSSVDANWLHDGRVVLRAQDRFSDSLFRADIESATLAKINTGQLNIHQVALTTNGKIYFTGSSAGTYRRLYRISIGASSPELIFDPNPQLAEVRLGRQTRITWNNSFGDPVDGIVIFPPDYVPGKRYPVLIDVYPTPPFDGLYLFAPNVMLGQIEAARGYVVFRPGVRAPHTAGGHYSRDAYYNEKARGAKGIRILVEDFVSGVTELVERGIVDPRRIGVFGYSNGGWAANFLITEPRSAELMRCAVIFAGSSSLIHQAFFGTGVYEGWVREVADVDLESKVEDYVALSPLLRMDRVQAKVLMMVGDQDWLTWLPEMIAQYSALKRLGKDAEFVRYADERHVFAKRENILDQRDRINRFFDNCLK